jgi:hypothetical protein
MRKIALIALALLAATPAMAGSRQGAKLDAITSGRLYDRILTPQLNPSYSFDAQGERQFLDDLRNGRSTLDAVPEGQREYFRMQMDMSR